MESRNLNIIILLVTNTPIVWCCLDLSSKWYGSTEPYHLTEKKTGFDQYHVTYFLYSAYFVFKMFMTLSTILNTILISYNALSCILYIHILVLFFPLLETSTRGMHD